LPGEGRGSFANRRISDVSNIQPEARRGGASLVRRHADTGDFVIVVNAEKAVLTGRKEEQKVYYRHSTYPGGLKAVSASDLRKRRPSKIIEKSVRGMLPKNRLGRRQFKKLKVYAGPEHPHQAQQPETLELSS
jgi:large subunit ribosomal protein L13